LETSHLGRVLIVDDDVDMAAVLRSSLEYDGCRADVCASLDEMKARVRQFSYDAVLLDLFIGDERGVEALPFLVRESPHAIVIVMTAFGSIELAVEAMGKGAASFLTKADDPGKITGELIARLKARVRLEGASNEARFRELGLLGQSRAMQELRDDILRIRDADDATVLIYGESGTGKELVARAIHRLSPRAEAQFEALNCAAIPEALLESELFGHRRGAFTDAKADRKGIFELCTHGTLLLDEIGEMPLSLQAKLLRVLQEKEVMPVGASKAVKVSTRVIAATNRDLEEEVARGRFREDLYFRLNVLPLYSPPLRERRGDMDILVNAFIDKFNTRYGKAIKPASRDLLLRLEAYEWPGNVRELQNSIERAVVLSRDVELHIEDVLQKKMHKKAARPGLGGGEQAMTLTYAEAKETFEKSFLLRILSAAKGSIAEAARISGRYRSDIYRLMERYGISADEFKD
jgi:DNA-binding NtrC family response regulator